MLSTAEQYRRQTLIDGFRAAADWLESHPDFPAPICPVEFIVFAHDLAELIELRRAGALADKYGDLGDNPYTGFRRAFGDMVAIKLLTDKDDTCQRVKVGERLVPAKPETLTPAEPEHFQPIYQWVCPDSMLATSRTDASDEFTT